MKDIIRPEILAPCGSYETLVAAINAGADACYIGGSKFGARAYAENLSNDLIEKAIDYTHLHGKKLYLTVNTLLKDNEINELYDYLYPYYTAGLDAVIVQDLGVFDFVRKNFPGIAIHCSTQMNITSVHAAAYMKSLGAKRVVTAREMTLDEIIKIKEKVDIEIESFVHGALCYSYSGQCLMSSYIGGRSGNRGRCAQPCRHCFDKNYDLSMKDLCSLELIPLLCDAGIDSFKIEGRMKNAYYVASAVDAYRELTEAYVSGCFSTEKALNYKNKLANVYNRGGFCTGYYTNIKKDNMITKYLPNNQGVKIGELIRTNAGKVTIKLCEDIAPQDVLTINLITKRYTDPKTMDISIKNGGKRNQTIELPAPKTALIDMKNRDVYRTRSNTLLADIEKNIINRQLKLPITGKFNAHNGDNMILSISISLDNRTYTAQSLGVKTEKSENKRDKKDVIKDIEAKLNKLGNTGYFFEKLIIDIDDDAFIPASILNQMRRDAVAGLEKNICEAFRRKYTEKKRYELPYNENCVKKIYSDKNAVDNIYNKGICVGIEDSEVFDSFIKIYQNKPFKIKRLYISPQIAKDKAFDKNYIKLRKNTELIITLPAIISYDFDLVKYTDALDYDGIYIKNIDGYAAYKQNKELFRDKTIVLAASLYAYNRYSRSFLYEDNIIFENPKELNPAELFALFDNSVGRNELVVYEYLPVMLTKQCVRKKRLGCNRDLNHNNKIKITDNKSNSFWAVQHCKDCYNIIYSDKPRLFNEIPENKFVYESLDAFKINFTLEDDAKMNIIIDKVNEQGVK